ncbi:MAG: hypothetical protein JWP00_700 [Chloroflexi bacterium]|jgi:hypothetical protein|nr:hypothetical protein [Chloroflexota bacterium]
MAVRAVRVGRWVQQPTKPVSATTFYYSCNNQVIVASKLKLAEFDEGHRQALLTARFNENRELVFGVTGWRSAWVGAGEEKAVYLIIDAQNRAFALEVLAKASYLDGKLTEGHYFADLHVPGIANVRWDKQSLFGHIFSGEVKAREFIYGDTLAGPGLRTKLVKPVNPLKRLIGGFCKFWAHSVVIPRYEAVRRTYRDAHEANVMVELLPISNPERKKHYLFPILWLEDDCRLHLRYFRLTPIDVRLR